VVITVGLAYKLLLPAVTNNEVCQPLPLYLHLANDYYNNLSPSVIIVNYDYTPAGTLTTMRQDIATQSLV